MILYNPSRSEEIALRVAYVKSPEFKFEDFNAYRNYVVNHVPGVIEAGYRGGDEPDTIETIAFENEQHLAWFKLRWS